LIIAKVCKTRAERPGRPGRLRPGRLKNGGGGSGIGDPLTDYLNGYRPGLGCFAIFGCDGVLFPLSTVSLLWVKGARLS